MSWRWGDVIVQVSVRLINLFIIIDILKSLPNDSIEVVPSGHTSGFELSHQVEGLLEVVNHVLRAKDVTPHMMWCCVDQLCLVGELVGLDLRLVSSMGSVFLAHDHMGKAKPADLCEKSLTSISPEPDPLSQHELFVLPFVPATKSSCSGPRLPQNQVGNPPCRLFWNL